MLSRQSDVGFSGRKERCQPVLKTRARLKRAIRKQLEKDKAAT